jgi:preprotein translocase subunit Sss1
VLIPFRAKNCCPVITQLTSNTILLNLRLHPPLPLNAPRQVRCNEESMRQINQESLVQIARIALMTSKPDTEVHHESTSRRACGCALVDSVDGSDAMGSATARRAVQDQSEADKLGEDGVAEVEVESALSEHVELCEHLVGGNFGALGVE